MTSLFIGSAIVVMFALRPFVYKPASHYFSAKSGSYFTAFWCLILALLTLPFCWEYLFLDETFILLSPYVLFPLSKGIPLYFFLCYWQDLNKENTSGASFYGVIALAAATIITTLLFNLPISLKQILIILLIGALGVLFFVLGEGKKLSSRGKKNFFFICLCAAMNTTLDTISIIYTNWYISFVFSFIGMVICALCFSRNDLKIKPFFSSWKIAIAGFIFAFGEILLIFSMQYVFTVIAATLLIRIGQSLDIILAHHIQKEGTISLQYFLAISTVILSYFFFY